MTVPVRKRRISDVTPELDGTSYLMSYQSLEGDTARHRGKPQREGLVKTRQGRIGVSSMDAETELIRNESDKSISRAKDSLEDLGVSSMDAEVKPRGSEAELTKSF